MERAIVLPKQARGKPQLANVKTFQHFLNSPEVIEVQVRQREKRQVRFLIALRQHLREMVDDLHARVVRLIGCFQMMKIDLDNHGSIDDDGRTVASSYWPKQ